MTKRAGLLPLSILAIPATTKQILSTVLNTYTDTQYSMTNTQKDRALTVVKVTNVSQWSPPHNHFCPFIFPPPRPLKEAILDSRIGCCHCSLRSTAVKAESVREMS